MIYENYNYMQIDFIGRTYNAPIIYISTRSIEKLYDIKATKLYLSLTLTYFFGFLRYNNISEFFT